MFSQSRETEKNLLMGNGIAVEYTRDSPLFRQQLAAVEESYSGISVYMQGLVNAFRDLQDAQNSVQHAHTNLVSRLLGRSEVSARCLFTNAFPELGDLAQNVHRLADVISGINDAYSKACCQLMGEVETIISSISSSQDTTTSKLAKNCDNLRAEYDLKLAEILKSRKKVQPEQEKSIMMARHDYELARFDLVSTVNENDRNKKLLMTKVVCNAFYMFRNLFQEGYDLAELRVPFFKKIQNRTAEVEASMPELRGAWQHVRDKLKGELLGARAPPGSPNGAMSPLNPRQHQGMPSYTAVITTEILSNNTRNATYYDVAHARDEGVYKQGYLFSWASKYFGTRKRRWYRLFSTKLYYVKFKAEELSCSMEVVADMSGCAVVAKPGDMPFLFSVTPTGCSEIDFQAENEDEMVLWISAIRRCSVSAPGRPMHSLIGDTCGRDDGGIVQKVQSPEDVREGVVEDRTPSEVVMLRLARSNVLHVNSWRNPEAEIKLIDFLKKNNHCAECQTHEQLKWISTSLGITLCEACAGAHRQLTWSVSKLKNIEFDEFPEWQIAMLHDELGNDVVNRIWEMNIPEGWTKPEAISPIEAKTNWVLAKYMWYGFVEELRIRSPEQLAEGLFEAVRSGTVADVMWWLSLKAEINCTLVSRYGSSTPMHIAVMGGRKNIVAFLALNGSDLYAQDDVGRTALGATVCIDEENGKTYISNLLEQIQHGEY